MQTAEKFSMPIFTFVDTPGAYPGIGAEERGQSEAIGHNLFVMSRLKTPIVATVIGEGGSAVPWRLQWLMSFRCFSIPLIPLFRRKAVLPFCGRVQLRLRMQQRPWD